MISTNRTTYDSGTPISTVFSFPPAPSVQGEPGNPQARQTTSSSKEPHCAKATRLNTWYFGAKTVFNNNTGLLLIAASQAFFSLMNVFVKKLSSLEDSVPALELIVVRMIMLTWICCVSYMLVTRVPDPFRGPKGVRILLILRGLFGFFDLFGLYFSLQYLSLSDATILTFLTPMCTAIAGALTLNENLQLKQLVAGFLSLVGVVLIARPKFLFGEHAHKGQGDRSGRAVTATQRLIAVGVSLLGVCGATGAYTTIRAIGKRAHAMHNLVSFSTQCVIVTPIMMIVSQTPIGIPKNFAFITMLALIGIFGFIGQFLLVLGLQRETAGRGTMAIYIDIVFAVAFEYLFFRIVPPPLSALGIIIILSAAIYVAVTKENTNGMQHKYTNIASEEDIAIEEGFIANDDVDNVAESMT
ncbi:unnamed protein product [Somion occarium]|uniref:EamA domain-containing protein n=1 Tax=Somion occarium TaxID=3059160 RepID=A0ABP1D3R2_9APHY